VRIDWNPSEKQRIFGRFSYDRLFLATFNAFGNMWDLNYAQNVTNGRNVLLADDITLNPTTVLQLRYSFTRHYESQGGDPGQNGFDITQLGFPSSLASEEVFKLLPFVTFNDAGNGVGGTANYNTFVYASQNSDVTASITKALNKHEISTGFEYMKRFLNVGQPPAASGSYAFDNSATDQTVDSAAGGSDFASLLIGMGTVPGSESDNYPNWSKDLFAAEASPYYAAFVEDTWRPRKALTVTAGLRWDIFGGRTERHDRLEYFNPAAQNTTTGVNYTGAEVYVDGHNRSPFETNLANFGPRLGLSWQTTSHLLVRGGAGFYYGPSAQMVGSASLNSDGYTSDTLWDVTCFNADGNTVFNGSPDCGGGSGDVRRAANAVDDFTVPYSLSNPFPNGVVPVFTTPPPGLANNLGTTLNSMLHSQRTVTTYNFNFGFEYEFPKQIVLSAAYVGSRGLFLPLGGVDLNQLSLEQIAKNGASLCVYPSSACQMVPNQWAAILPPTNSNFGADSVPLWVAVQPYPQFGNGSYGGGNGVNIHGYPGGDSDYSSLQTKLQRRLTHHFTALASFTWAKLITDDGNPPLGFVGSHNGSPQDWRNMNLEHSISPQDVKYQFTGQASYDLPVGKGMPMDLNGVADAVLGGWTFNGILYLSSGVPIASPGSGNPISYFNQRANVVCDPSKGAPHTAAVWFNYTCFTPPGVPAGTMSLDTANPFIPGTAPAYLDNVRTMGARNLDLSIYKKFSFGEEKDLRFEVSSYNITNRAQLGMPNVPSPVDVWNQIAQGQQPNFGQITNTVNSPRQFQFGARFTF
jgi:hypothetical protein